MPETLTILDTPVVPAVDAPIIVDELVLEDGSTFGKFNLCHIRISSTNRKRFNEEKLRQLADSIRAKGVAQPILLRPVEPTDAAPQAYEIIAGERRFRASVMAGLTHIPAISRAMSDHDAIELQILENLQREDPHPLEEAEGYERLMLTHGYSADQLAERLKKSRSYIYGRLKLCALALDVREPFLNDEISASTALLIARIPVPKLQAQALQEILKPPYGSEPMSYRAAAQHVQNRYTLALATAPFDIKDPKLLASAGNCTGCPKRTGNQPVLYPGVDANICTDPECFAEKRGAQDAKLIVQANKAKIPVLRGDEAKAILADPYVITDASGTWRLDRVAQTASSDVIGRALTEKQLPTPIAVLELDNGTVRRQYDKTALQAAAEAAGICLTRDAWDALQAEKNASPQAQARKEEQARRDAEYAAKTARAEALTEERTALYRKVRQLVGKGLSLASTRELAKALLMDRALPDDLLGDDYPLTNLSDEAVTEYIDQANHSEVQMLIFDLVFGDTLHVMHWQIGEGAEDDDDDSFAFVRAIARHEGIDTSPCQQDAGEPPSLPSTGLQPQEESESRPHQHARAAEPLLAAAEEQSVEAPRKTLTLKPRTAASSDADAPAGPTIRTKKPPRTVSLPSAIAYTAPESDATNE